MPVHVATEHDPFFDHPFFTEKKEEFREFLERERMLEEYKKCFLGKGRFDTIEKSPPDDYVVDAFCWSVDSIDWHGLHNKWIEDLCSQ